MARLKIAVYTMAKNEAAHVSRFAETTRGADVVVVTDTGSTDGTPDLLREQGIEVRTARIVPWRFDIATNTALAHVPDDVDVCVKLDLDEVLYTADGSPWRDEVERLWTTDVNRLRYWYTWSWHVPGQVPAVRFRTENIHGRGGFVWRHAGHAALCCNDHGKQTANSDKLEIHHYMVSKGRPDYLHLLQLAVFENKCPRTLFYLGREYYFRKINDRAIEALKEYLAHPESKWKAERADALRLIGISCQRQGDEQRALAYLMQAIAEYPGVRDLWFELLRYFHDTGDFLGGYWAGVKCLAIQDRDAQFIAHSGEAWHDLPLVLTARCALQTGRADEARQLIEQALKLNPDSKPARTLAQAIGM